jgi:hypothetical protein
VPVRGSYQSKSRRDADEARWLRKASFTLHVLWPFLWIWAMAYQPERGWGFSGAGASAGTPLNPSDIDDLQRRIAELEKGRMNPGA